MITQVAGPVRVNFERCLLANKLANQKTPDFHSQSYSNWRLDLDEILVKINSETHFCDVPLNMNVKPFKPETPNLEISMLLCIF